MINSYRLPISYFIYCIILVGCGKDSFTEFNERIGNPISVITELHERHNLPVFKITIDEKYLWSADSGLFVDGNNEVLNYFQGWEFPAEVSYFENGKPIFKHDVGFQIKGKGSRRKPNKSIGLYWRKKYGENNLKYRIFPDRNIDTFKRLKLRNGGSHGANLLIREAGIMKVLENKTALNFSASKPVVVYINDEYWGIYILNELFTPHYFKYYYGVDKDEVNILGAVPEYPGVDDGNTEQWREEVIAFFMNNDLSVDANYNKALDLIDIENLIDYFIVETYVINRDWPIHNMKWWSEPSDPNYRRWRHILFDLDTSFDRDHAKYIWLGNFYRNADDVVLLELQRGFLLFDHLMKNRNFKVRFFERYIYFMDNVFTVERVNEKFDGLIEEIGIEYDDYALRWGYRDRSSWISGIELLKEFNVIRQEWLRPKIQQWYEEAKSE